MARCAGRVEPAGDDAWHEAGVGGEHLVGGDHREAVAEHDDDRASTPVRLDGSTTWSGTSTRSPARSLYQWTRHRLRGVRSLWVGVADLGGVVEGRGILELGERRQRDALLTEPFDAVGERSFVDDPVGEPELILERLRGGIDVGGRCGHLDILSKRSRTVRNWPRPGPGADRRRAKAGSPKRAQEQAVRRASKKEDETGRHR